MMCPWKSQSHLWFPSKSSFLWLLCCGLKSSVAFQIQQCHIKAEKLECSNMLSMTRLPAETSASGEENDHVRTAGPILQIEKWRSMIWTSERSQRGHWVCVCAYSIWLGESWRGWMYWRVFSWFSPGLCFCILNIELSVTTARLQASEVLSGDEWLHVGQV